MSNIKNEDLPKDIVLFGFIIAALVGSAMACVDNTLWAYNTSIASYNNSTYYNCYDLNLSINAGYITSPWYTQNWEVLNTTENVTQYCYDNVYTTRVCLYNVTANITTVSFDLLSVDSVGLNSTPSCGFTSSGTWCNTSYTYNSEVIAINSGASESNKILGVYFNSTTQPADLNFTTDQYVTFYDTSCNKLSHWTETWDSTNSIASLHVNVTGTLASGNTTLYMYFHNTTSVGDPSITTFFDFMDEFTRADSGTVNNGWTEGEAGGTFAISGNTLLLTKTGAGDTTVQHTATHGSTATRSYIVKAKTSATTNQHAPEMSISNNDGTPNYYLDRVGYFYFHDSANIKSSSAGTVIYTPYAANTYYHLRVDMNRNGNTEDIFINGNRVLNNAAFDQADSTADFYMWVASNTNGAFTSTIDSYGEGNYFTDSISYGFGTRTNYTLGGGCEVSNCTVHQLPLAEQNYGYYTANIYNEADNTGWDFTKTQNETITFTCESSQSIQNLTGGGQHFILTDTPRVVKVNVNFTSTGDEYYRKQVPTCTGPCAESVSFYLVDLASSTLTQLTLTMQDWTGLFGGAEVRFKRPILTSGVIQITSDLFDAEKKAILYLVKDMEYQIEVYKNGISKSIGYIIIDADTEKTITIADVEYDETETRLYEDILMGTDVDLTYLTGYYNDTSGTTTSVDFNIYNLTDGSLIYSDTSTAQYCTFSYNYSAEYSTPYKITITAANSELGTVNNTWYINYRDTTIPIGSGLLSSATYNIISVIILLGVASMAGALYLPAGVFAFIVTAIVLSWMNWLQTPALLLSMATLLGLIIAAMTNKGDSE